MHEQIRKLNGANMDIDLTSEQGSIPWKQDHCPGMKQKAQTRINVL